MKVVGPFANLAAAQTIVQFIDKANGYPLIGKRRRMSDGVDVDDPQFPTTTWGGLLQHPSNGNYAVIYDDTLLLLTTAAAEARLVPAKLTQTQYDNLKAKILGAAEIPAGWLPSAPSTA